MVRSLFAVLMLQSCLVAQAPQLLPSAKILQYRELLPQVEDPRLQELFQSPDTVWYDNDVIRPAYQIFDTEAQVNGTSIAGLHDPNYDISGGVDALKLGNPNMEFPWRKAGGTHLTDPSTIGTFKFFQLPRDRFNRFYPVVLFRLRSQLHQRWIFPLGTVFGEVLLVRDPAGGWRPFEVRLRTREPDDWETAVHRPFGNKYELVLAVVSEGEVELGSRIGGGQGVLITATTGAASSGFHRTGRLQTLPEMSADLVRKLLERPFVDGTGVSWSPDADGPTTRQDFSIVPNRYLGGVLGDGSREGCRNCHNSVGRKAEEFNPDREWYGRVRGSDGIFSWHPFAHESISSNGRGKPIKYRQEFLRAGLLEGWNPREHSSRIYQLSKFEKDRT